jgi:hypothetical protein
MPIIDCKYMVQDVKNVCLKKYYCVKVNLKNF